MDDAELAALDGIQYDALNALAYVGEPKVQSAFMPQLFTCSDGRNYWVKRDAQQGLLAELVAGRLAALTDAGPSARIIRIAPEALTGTPVDQAFVGVRVGTLDIPNAVNAKDLHQLGIGDVDPALIVAEDRARVVVFQSWIAANDGQVLLDMATGRMWSIDHGDVFGATAALSDPHLVITHVPGLPPNHGCDGNLVAEAVASVESVGDANILESVARMPTDAEWRSAPERRIEIARWLAHRRDRMSECMKAWQ